MNEICYNLKGYNSLEKKFNLVDNVDVVGWIGVFFL